MIGKTCPYCLVQVDRNADIVVCPLCRIPHHRDCWAENGGCTTFGCQGHTEARPAPPPPPHMQDSPDTLVITLDDLETVDDPMQGIRKYPSWTTTAATVAGLAFFFIALVLLIYFAQKPHTAPSRQRPVYSPPVAPPTRMTADQHGQMGLHLLYASRDALAAEHELRLAAQLDPGNPEWCYHLGVAASQSGNQGTAYKAFRRYLQLAPGGQYAGEVKRRLIQLEPRVSIESIRVDASHTAGMSGELIVHSNISLHNLRGQTCAIWYLLRENNRGWAPVLSNHPGYRALDGSFWAHTSVNPQHTSTRITDLSMIIPQSTLELSPGTWKLKLRMEIRDEYNHRQLYAASKWVPFRMVKP